MKKFINKYRFEIFRYFLLILMLFICAINFNLFMKPLSFVTGGTTGLALIIEHFTGISLNTGIYIIYIITFIISFIILGKKSFLGVLVATISYPLFMSLTENVASLFTIDYSDFIFISILTGIISGASNGLIYKIGFASSGLSVLGPIFNKCFHMSIASTNFVVNALIVLAGGYSFGIEMILYAIIFLYVSKIVSNKVILGISSNKAIFICSDKINEISKLLYEDYHIESIILDTSSKDNKDTILFTISNNMYYKIIKKIELIDNNVFYNVLDGYELNS